MSKRMQLFTCLVVILVLLDIGAVAAATAGRPLPCMLTLASQRSKKDKQWKEELDWAYQERIRLMLVLICISSWILDFTEAQGGRHGTLLLTHSNHCGIPTISDTGQRRMTPSTLNPAKRVGKL